MSNAPQDPNALARALTGSTPADPAHALRENYQRILEYVWRKPDNCPICDSTSWNIGDLVDVPLRGVPQGMDLAAALSSRSPRVYVYVPVTCVYCGYTIFFHSGVLDVRDTEEVKATPPIRVDPGPTS
jgi:hypothetical protein